MKKKLYIIADTRDNTITLSSALCNELSVTLGDPRVFLFTIKGTGEYAFKRVPLQFANTTVCGIVSYNPQLKTYGFVSHCPTVNLMFHTMNIQKTKKKLKVEKHELPDHSTIYKIITPQ